MPKKGKLVVLGTGDLAIPALEAVAEAGHELLRLVAQPRRSGEDGILPEERQGSQLVAWARGRDIPVSRPGAPDSERMRKELEELAPDIGLMVAYGRAFPLSLLEVPERGWLKVHFSLLPKYRGLHPVRAAIWNGERQSGATVIQVTEEPDAGPIIGQESVDIGPQETFGELAPRVAEAAAAAVVPALAAALRSKKPKVRKQNEKSASSTPRFGRRHRYAPWWRKADMVYDHLRALSPEPGMTMMARRSRVRILKGEPINYVEAPFGEGGSYIGLRSGRLAILCGEGSVFGVELVEGEDGEPMSAVDFARERKLQVGDVVV